MSEVIYSLTESPTTGETVRLPDEWEEHAEFTVWHGDNWQQCVLHWAISVSKHAPELSTDHYITKVWKSTPSESGLFQTTERIEITHKHTSRLPRFMEDLE